MANQKIEWLNRRLSSLLSFLSSDLAVYSDSMSFLSIFTFIPFMMLGVFAAVNLSFFAEYFNNFRLFLYENLFVDSAETLVYYLNIFLQNSSKLGLVGVIFALYSIFVFTKQLDYCIHRLAGIQNVSFGIGRFLKYFAVMAFTILSVSLSAVFEAVGAFLGFNFFALFASGFQMWLAILLLFYFASPVSKSVRRAAVYSILCAISLVVLKKLFVYYILFSASYNTIYGSFAVLFWFFVWLNFSWYIFFACIKLYLSK
jgi:membrane protein